MPVDLRATDTAYRLNYHSIWEQAVVIRLCEVMAAVMPHQWAISIKMPASMHNAKRMVTISDNILFILR